PSAVALPPSPTLFPSTTLFRSRRRRGPARPRQGALRSLRATHLVLGASPRRGKRGRLRNRRAARRAGGRGISAERRAAQQSRGADRKSTRLNSSHLGISYAVFC